jgi:cytidine deaminase
LSASDDKKDWPEVERRNAERRRGRERRTRADRRNEAAWVPIPLDADEEAAQERTLIDTAREARQRAQAPYSNFKVGAALQLPNGPIVGGCNIENATYGLTLCAERVALVKALSDGHTIFSRIAVVADTESPTPPCGPCRQLLWEYCGDIEIILANLHAVTGRHRLSELLPIPFDGRLLK